MTVREDAKKIAQRLLEVVIEEGTFRQSYTLEFEMLADGFGLSDKRRRLCLEYLEHIGCIDYKVDEEEKIKILPRIVDYVEADDLP